MNKPHTSRTATSFGKFDVVTLSKDQASSNYLSTQGRHICLLPFEMNVEKSIKSVFLLEFPNHSLGQTAHSLVIDEMDPNTDSTPFDAVCRALIEEAGVNIDELGLNENQIFYLGDITTSFPVSSTMHCYGIDVTGKSALEFTRNLSKDQFTKDESSIIKVGFHQVVNGDYSDSTVLAGSFLLVSYFN